MSLDEEYPKTRRDLAARLRALLEAVPDLPERDRAELATALNVMADRARDLDDIVQRLLNEPHTLREIGELLIVFRRARMVLFQTEVCRGKTQGQ